MKKTIISIVVIITLFTSCQESKKSNQTDNIIINRIESYLKECVENGLSGSILVAQEGEILFSGGLGLSNRKGNIAVTKGTVYTVGSITKQFTATAILALQEEGKLSVKDSISKFFPDIPADKRNITIHQLLTHTSGIVGNLDNGGDFVPIKKEAFLSQAFSSPLDVHSGSEYHYSNVGYSLLAIILEEITQQDYEECLQQVLFKKAGMKNTGYLLPNWDKTKIARAYKCEEDRGTHLEKWEATSNQVSYHLKGNGGILSTPSDLYKWYIALKENKIISKKSYEQLVYPHILRKGHEEQHYGYGWIIFNSERNTKRIAHSGYNGVNYANFIQLPEEKNTVIIYMTSLVRQSDMKIGREVEKLIFDKTYSPIVPKMTSTKYSSGKEPNKRMAIINEFVTILLKIKPEQTVSVLNSFVEKNIPNKSKHEEFKEYLIAMQEEFSGYKLLHTLEYDDLTYDIMLESKDGTVAELTPCFDLKFNQQNQIIDFGW